MRGIIKFLTTFSDNILLGDYMKWLIVIFFLCLSCTKNELKAERNHLNQVSGPYSHLDPQVATGLAANLIMAKSYESLYEVNPYHAPFDLLPLLASELPEISNDGLVYKINIRKFINMANKNCVRLKIFNCFFY